MVPERAVVRRSSYISLSQGLGTRSDGSGNENYSSVCSDGVSELAVRLKRSPMYWNLGHVIAGDGDVLVHWELDSSEKRLKRDDANYVEASSSLFDIPV